MKERESLSQAASKKIKELCRSKYRIRILLAFFAVAVLAIGVLDVAVFRGLSGQIQEETEKETKEMLENMTSSYENQVVQYHDQAQLLYRNLNVKSYLASGGREDSHLDTITQSMQALAGNTTGISSVILFYKEEILASYDTGMVMTEAKQEIVERIQSTTTDKELFFVWTDNKKSRRQMVLFWSDREYLYGPSNYGVALVVSMDAIQDKVVPWNQKVENPIYIFHNTGELVAAQKIGYEDGMEAIFQNIETKDEDSGVWYETVNGKEQRIFYVKPEDSRFITVRIQEVPDSQEQVSRALHTILISTALGMGLSLIIVWVVSGWMYRPLGAIFRNILELADSGEDEKKEELVLVTDALADVNTNMNLLRCQIRNNAVVHFLRQGNSGEKIDRNIFEFPDGEEPKAFSLMLLRYYMEDWSQREALLDKLKKMTAATGEQLHVGTRCYRMVQGKIAVLIYEKNEAEKLEKETEWAEEILKELEETYGIKGCIGIGKCEGLKRLPKAYQTAEMLTEYYILSKDIRVISEEMLKEKKHGPVQEPEREQILRFVKEDTEEEVSGTLHRLLQNLTVYQLSDAQDYLKGLIAEVIRLSENISGEKGVQYESYLKDFLTNEIFIGQADMEEWLAELFIQVKAQLKAGRQSNASRIMGEVTAYIEQNYSDCALSVETVAEQYGLSVSYFSKLFNQYTGKTFPDYMNQLRLKKAKELLLEKPNTPIAEIAVMVGFNSSSYFSAAFRKYYGVSPSKIRKNR